MSECQKMSLKKNEQIKTQITIKYTITFTKTLTEKSVDEVYFPFYVFRFSLSC